MCPRGRPRGQGRPRGLHLWLAQKSFSSLVGYSSSQRWSSRGRPWPQGHILKALALASKPHVLKNCPVLGSKTALFLNL